MTILTSNKVKVTGSSHKATGRQEIKDPAKVARGKADLAVHKAIRIGPKEIESQDLQGLVLTIRQKQVSNFEFYFKQ